MKYGDGIYTFSNGEKYMGEWKDDKIHGEGIYICGDGEKYIGTWEDDEAVSYKKI